MENDVAKIISEILHVPRSGLSEHARIADLAQDSMDVIELIAALTDEYGLEMDASNLSRLKTVGDVVRYVRAHTHHGHRRAWLKTF